jgi:outer membrane protein insertion porin family
MRPPRTITDLLARLARAVPIALLAAVALAADAASAAAEASWPRIVDVRIDGVRLFSPSDLRRDWAAAIGAPADPAALAAAADRTLARYAAAGRLDALCRLRLEPVRGDSVALHVTIDEGTETTLGEIAIEGAEAIPEAEARRTLALDEGDAFHPSRFAQGLEELLDRYESEGHPFARITPRDFAMGETLTFRVLVDEGPLARVLGLAVTGNRSTRESYIAREMRLDAGKPWNRTVLEQGRGRLLRTGLFASVGEPFPLVDEAGGGVRVGLAVEEAPANRLEGVFGWNQGGPAEEGFFSGYIDVLFRNLGGVGRRVAARWERRGRDAREIRLGYREPWLPLVPAGIALDLRRTFRDSTYVRTEIEGALDIPVDASVTFSARGGIDSWSPGDRTPATVPTSRRGRGGFGFRFEGTDYPPNPSRGVNLAIAGEYGSKRVEALAGGAGDSSAASETVRFAERIGHGALDLFVPLGGPHLIALRARADGVWSDERPVPEYEMFFLGGARSLRGYDEDQFLGERVGVATFEYRFRLASRARLFLFVDQGYFLLERDRGDGSIERVEGDPLGWGGGLQAESRLGVLGIGVGMPEGEGLSAARVHVSLEQEF